MAKIMAAVITLVILSNRSVAQDSPVEFPKPILKGTIEATPTLARVEPIVIETIGGISESKEEHFMLAIKLNNRSSTKRVDFKGWPHPHGLAINCKAFDEHDNKYKTVTFGFGTKPAANEAGETIEPGGFRLAIIVFEKPIALANTMTIDLDGEAIGQEGTRLKWVLQKSDWATPPKEDNQTKQKAETTSPFKPAPTPPAMRTWSSVDGKFTIEAAFVSFANGQVKLRKTDGAEVVVGIDRLSQEDQKWIRDKRK